MDVITLSIAKNYAKSLFTNVMVGVKSHTVDNTNKTITFVFNDDSTETIQFDQPKDGISIKNVEIDADNHIICTLSDYTKIDAGQLNIDTEELRSDVDTLKTDVTNIESELDNKQNKLTAGNNITISSTGVISATGGGTGDEGATADWVTNTAWGNLAAGTDTTGKTALELIKMATISYVNPKATVSYSISSTILETGSSSTVVVSVSGITKGTSDVSKIQLYNGNTLLQEKTYSTSTSSYVFDGVAINSNTTFNIRVVDTQNKYTAYSRTYTFVSATYYGTSDTAPTGVTGLTKVLRTKATFENKFTCDNKHVVYMYPASFGDLRSILDGNGFENLTDFTKTTITIGSVSYNAYYTTGKKTLNSFTYKFIY